VFLNLWASLEKACALVEQAAGAGAQIIAFPETWLPGYPIWLDWAPRAAEWDYAPAKALYRLLFEGAVSIEYPGGGPHLEPLLSAAKRTGSYIVMGVHERDGGTLYNTVITIAPDGLEFKIHRKLVPTYGERLVWGRGDGSTLGVMGTPHGNLGGLICWEHWMPLARAAMHALGETVHVAQWPAVKDLHHIASRHYAFEGQCYVLAAGAVLTKADALDGFHSLQRPDSAALELLGSMPCEDDHLLLQGGSAVIAPDSSYVAGPVHDEAAIITAEIDPARITESYLTIDTQGHYSRPDVFHLKVDARPKSNVTFQA
jgi:predicted amidohydrolase